MSEIDEYVKLARESGCTEDQMERFLSAGYVALPTFLKFHATARAIDNKVGYDEIMLDGTRGSAKSHAIIAQTAIDDCQKYDGLKFLFLRQTQRAAMESFRDLVNRVLKFVPHTMGNSKIEFPNGSTIFIGGYKDDNDINKSVNPDALNFRRSWLDRLRGSWMLMRIKKVISNRKIIFQWLISKDKIKNR